MTTLIALTLFTIGFVVTFVVPHESADRFLHGMHVTAKFVRFICALMFALTLTAFFIAKVPEPLVWDSLSNKGTFLFLYGFICIAIFTAYVFYGVRYRPFLSFIILLLMEKSGFAAIALTNEMLVSHKIAEMSSAVTLIYSSAIGVVVVIILIVISNFLRRKKKNVPRVLLYLRGATLAVSVFLMLYVLCHNVFYLAAVL